MNKTNKQGKEKEQKNKIKHMQAIRAMQPCKNYLEGDLGKLR